MRRLIAIATLTLAGMCSPAAVQADGVTSISGIAIERVEFARGFIGAHPTNRAVVRLVGDDGNEQHVRVDEKGTFSVFGLHAQRYTLQAYIYNGAFGPGVSAPLSFYVYEGAHYRVEVPIRVDATDSFRVSAAAAAAGARVSSSPRWLALDRPRLLNADTANVHILR